MKTRRSNCWLPSRDADQDGSGMADFLVMIHNCGCPKRLTVDEQKELGRRMRAGDADAREKLICGTLFMVANIATHFFRNGIDPNDLIGDGILGLLHATRKYDPLRGAFTTYARWWIYQYMQQHVAKFVAPNITFPVMHSRDPNARYRQTAIDTIDRLRRAVDVADCEDKLEDQAFSERDALLVEPEDRERLRSALAQLKPRWRDVIVMRFYKSMTMQEVSDVLGITKERIRQIEKKAIEYLALLLGGTKPPLSMRAVSGYASTKPLPTGG